MTDIEKRLISLKAQLYGKEQILPKAAAFQTHPVAGHEIDFLKHDLLKTIAFAALAITIQLLLFVSINRGFIRF
ncbi:MAG: hypothetical protein UU67_C0003G0004 [Candidatus Daviesbacteria bacterium GW2011_GWB1_41_5]|nr:MAG: hypothetical protein UU67_C0003G0004 [Candidatus Daviesbacteria bacterium GW2011_GWB1_41_5]